MNVSAITEVRKAAPYFEACYKMIDISFCATIYKDAIHDPILDGDDWEMRMDELDKQLKGRGIRVNTTHLPYRYHYEDPSSENYAYHYEMTRRSLIASERLGAKWAVVHVNSVDATVAHVKKLFADTGVKTVGLAIENMAKSPIEELIEAHDILLMILPEVRTLSQLRLTFWSDFRYPIRVTMAPNRQRQQRIGVPTELVKDYTVRLLLDHTIVKEITVKDNYQRLNVLNFDCVMCDSAEITVHSTNGYRDAVIFEVRAY